MSQGPGSFTRVRRIAGVTTAVMLTVTMAAALAAPQLTNITISSYAVPLQGAAAGTVTLDQASAGVMAVSLSSSNTRVVSVPGSIPVQPRSTTATFVAVGAGPGCATVTASFGGRTRTRDVVVHPASSATTLKLTVPNQILPLGGTIAASVSVGPSALTSASLSVRDSAVATVPATVPLTRGSGNFSIRALNQGCATITATAAGQTVSKTIRVVYIGG